MDGGQPIRGMDRKRQNRMRKLIIIIILSPFLSSFLVSAAVTVALLCSLARRLLATIMPHGKMLSVKAKTQEHADRQIRILHTHYIPVQEKALAVHLFAWQTLHAQIHFTFFWNGCCCQLNI